MYLDNHMNGYTVYSI